MDKQGLIEKERRWAPWALAAVFGAVVLVLAGQAIEASVVGDTEGDAENLVERAEATGKVVAAGALRMVGFGLLLVPLLLLFDAAAARSDRDMRRYRLLVIAGPIAFAVSSLLLPIALDSAAQEFVEGTPTGGDEGEQRAEDVITETGLFGLGQGFALAGLLGVTFGLVYSSLQAMRVGLLTRFWGTLGMAFGAFFLIGSIGGNPVGVLGTVFFLLHVALVANDRWFGERPPAWDAAEAVPWDPPGGGGGRGSGDEGGEDEELASPDDFEGEGREVERERPGRRDNRRKRKRKRRG